MDRITIYISQHSLVWSLGMSVGLACVIEGSVRVVGDCRRELGIYSYIYIYICVLGGHAAVCVCVVPCVLRSLRRCRIDLQRCWSHIGCDVDTLYRKPWIFSRFTSTTRRIFRMETTTVVEERCAKLFPMTLLKVTFDM